MGLYQELGVKTYINALDTVSIFGGSRMHESIFNAMEEASRNFIEIADFQQKACAQIAEWTRNEAAYITSGASAALLMSAAVCMAGSDLERLKQLPDTRGMKNEILVMSGQKTGYDHALRVAGATPVYVDTGKDGRHILEQAITSQTAAIYFFDLYGAYERSLSFEDTAAIAKAAGLPLIVDAAAQLPPIENLWRFTHGGADAVCFSGGKGLRGPQSGGLILGRQWVIDGVAAIAPPIHGIARSSKVGREEIAGVYTALAEYLRPGMVEAKVATIEARGAYIRAMLDSSGLFECERIYPGPTGQSYPYIGADILKGFEPEALIDALRAGEPGVLIGKLGPNRLMINPLLLRDDEVDIVIDRILHHARQLAEGISEKANT